MTDVEVSIRIEARPDDDLPLFHRSGAHVRVDGHHGRCRPPTGRAVPRRRERDRFAVGEYVEIVPDERVVWTWGWEGDAGVPPGSSTVEITLVPDGDATLVRLRHSGLPDADAEKQHRHGWEHYWQRLALAAAGGDPGPDEWVTQK